MLLLMRLTEENLRDAEAPSTSSNCKSAIFVIHHGMFLSREIFCIYFEQEQDPCESALPTNRAPLSCLGHSCICNHYHNITKTNPFSSASTSETPNPSNLLEPRCSVENVLTRARKTPRYVRRTRNKNKLTRNRTNEKRKEYFSCTIGKESTSASYTTRSNLTRLECTYDSYVEVKNRRRTHFHSHFYPFLVLLLYTQDHEMVR